MTSGGMSPSHTHTQSHSLHSSSAEGSDGRAWPTLGAMSAEAATVVRSTASTDSDAGSDQSDSETHRSNGAATDSPNEADIATHDAAVTIATHTDAPHHPECVVVVDPVSTGANVADAFIRAGYVVICITTGKVAHETPIPADCPLRRDYMANLTYDAADPASVVVALDRFPVRLVGMVSGSELGVEACDRLTELLGLPSNGSALSEARRDKSLMQDRVRAAGLRAAKQARACSWADVERFLDWDSMPQVVVKPARSAGSDHVAKASSTAQTRAAFDAIIGAPNALGGVNNAVVVQEFLQGSEYVVDSVSRDGVHKVVAIWEYDKRSFCGHDFIYFGQKCVSGTDAAGPGPALAHYAVRVLDALGVRHGAGHAEIIVTPTGPCLVEVGCRPQGNEGTFMPLADRVWGYNQVGALLAATTDQAAFDALPSVCGSGMVHGFKIDFVSAIEGRIAKVQHLDAMSTLSSFVQFDLLPAVGDRLDRTVDCFTACGSVTLAHADKQQLDADCEAVRKLNETMWIVDCSTSGEKRE